MPPKEGGKPSQPVGQMGWFQSPGFISIGDEYDKKEKQHSRYKGRNFVTNPSKKGRGMDCTFDKRYKSLSEGDKYVDPGTYEKKVRLEESKKKLTTKGFTYTNPSKKSCGLGNYYGTFNEKHKYAHEVEYNVLKKGELPQKHEPQPKNILTAPTKRGTFGVPGTTISHGDEFKYVSDPYLPPTVSVNVNTNATKSVKGAAPPPQPIGPPFKSTCRRLDYFDETSKVRTSKIFSIDKALPAKKAPKDEEKKGPIGAKPWKPSNPSHQGINSTLNPFPEYKEDPLELKERKQREARQKERPQVVWKPISSVKTSPTRVVRCGPPPE
eukprot:PhF_6_TR40685/c0_g1_i2/m.61140